MGGACRNTALQAVWSVGVRAERPGSGCDLRGEHSDDLVRHSVDAHGRSDDSRIGTVPFSPGRVGEEDHGLGGGIVLSVSARGFRPEVQVDRMRQEIRFASRNPRGRGQILATVDLDQIVGVGVTKSIDGPDCHCLIYMIDGEKPLRIASGTEKEIKAIRNRMNGIVVSPAERLAARMEAAQSVAA